MKPQTIAKETLLIMLSVRLFSCSEPLGEEEVRQLLSEKGLFAKSYTWSGLAVNDTSAGFANQFSLSFDSSLVYDAACGLTWQHGGSVEELTYKGADSYIKSLNRIQYSGFDDWRLPTLEEAMTLMEPQKRNWVHVDPMFNSHQRWIWTANKFDSQHVWRVFFGNGNCEPLGVQRYQFVRAVRTGIEKKVNLTETIYGGLFALNQFANIPAGSFLMGSVDDSSHTDEQPVHRVRISREFYMGRHEVTQAQWQEVMNDNPNTFTGDSLPVENVSWVDVENFIKNLNDAIGRTAYRLPTDAEWEYACRAGTTTPFNTGENLTTDQANYNGKFPYKDFPQGENRKHTTPVGSFTRNKWGLYDMHGNVYEWCSDWYSADYNQQITDKVAVDPQGPSSGSGRVLRGGSWFFNAQYCRSAFRNWGDPDFRDYDVGFRLVFVP